MIESDDYEIVFVDNASNDGSVEFVKNHFPQGKDNFFEKNFGFAEGCNLELKSWGRLHCFLNDTKVVFIGLNHYWRP